MRDAPLGLPDGSIRAIISLCIIVGGIIAVFLADTQTKQVMMNLVLMVVAFYFGSKIPTKKER